MKEHLANIFQTVREEAAVSVWSRGVEIARSGTVVALDIGEDECTFSVAAEGMVLRQRTVISIADESFGCSCGGPEPCEHVAAAVIAARNGKVSFSASPEGPTSAMAHVQYRFIRQGGGNLGFERWVVGGNVDKPILRSIRAEYGAYLSGRTRTDSIQFTQDDLGIDAGLDGRAGVQSYRWMMPSLARCADVAVDGVPVKVHREQVEEWVEVRDEPQGIRVVGCTALVGGERFNQGVAVAPGTMQPLPEHSFDPEELAMVRGKGCIIPPRDRSALMKLVTETLPGLSRKIEVRVLSSRLPEIVEAHVRPVWTVEDRPGDELWVYCILGYGEPLIATVTGNELVQAQGSAGRKIPRRRPDEELAVAKLLYREIGLRVGVPLIVRGDEAVRIRARLSTLGVPESMAPGLSQERILVPEIAAGRESLDVHFLPSGGSDTQRQKSMSFKQVYEAWARGQSYIRLEGGQGVGKIPREWLQQYGPRLLELMAEIESAREVPKQRIPEIQDMVAEVGGTLDQGLRELADLISGNEMTAEPLPPDVTATVRGYQHAGYSWLTRLRNVGLGGMLADDMGLGKTLQAILGIRGRTLIVCPTSVLTAWRDQIRQFRPNLSVSTFHGQDRSLGNADGVVLTTYGLLRRDIAMFEESSWDMVVFDESQTLKNPDSQVTRAAMRLGGAFKLALTGTPLENNLLDLWSQFRCILPGLLPSREDFAGLCDRNPEQAVLLAKGRIRPFLLRRLKRDVLSELPAKTESILRVELNESELETYRAMLLATRRELLAEAGSEVSVMEVLEAILRLRQACCDPRLLDPISSTEASTKIQFLGDRLVELIEAGHRCLVFSQWTTYLDLIEPELTKRSIEFSRLDGTTRDRGAIVSSFQADDGPPVMLLSLKAGGVGLTLTAADHVFLMDPWWNPAVEEQAADRAHRIGQKDPVFVHRIIAQDTIEERILELQERKRSLASALLSDGDGGLRITKEELLELIG